MKCTAKITSKGQVTIPAEVRRALGVREGDTVIFQSDSDGMRVLPKRDGTSPFAKYQGIGNPGIPSGIENIVRYFREIRGHDPDEDEWEEAYEAAMRAKAQTKKRA